MMVEQVNRYLNKDLKLMSNKCGSIQVAMEAILLLLYAWNSAPIPGTDLSRCFVALGQEFQFPVDFSSNNTGNSLQFRPQSNRIRGSLPNIFKPCRRLPASLSENSEQCTMSSSTHVNLTPKYIQSGISYFLAELCGLTLLEEKLSNLPIHSLGHGVSLPNFTVHLTTSKTVPQRRRRSGMPRTYLHTLQSCYPSNHLTVLTIGMANSIKRYPRICTSRQGSKVLNHQRRLKFQHYNSLRTRPLTPAGPHWPSSTRTSFHIHGHLARNLMHISSATRRFLHQDSIQDHHPRHPTTHPRQFLRPQSWLNISLPVWINSSSFSTLLALEMFKSGA